MQVVYFRDIIVPVAGTLIIGINRRDPTSCSSAHRARTRIRSRQRCVHSCRALSRHGARAATHLGYVPPPAPVVHKIERYWVETLRD